MNGFNKGYTIERDFSTGDRFRRMAYRPMSLEHQNHDLILAIKLMKLWFPDHDSAMKAARKFAKMYGADLEVEKKKF